MPAQDSGFHGTHLYVELPFAAGVIHVSNLAENLALLPSHVVDAHHRPGAAREAVGIFPVQLVLVVQKDAPLRGGRKGGEEKNRAGRGRQGPGAMLNLSAKY